MLKIIYSESSRKDIREIVLWYNLQRIGLEDEFLVILNDKVSRLQNKPKMYQVMFRQVRAVTIRKFPYRVFYKIIDEAIIIIGVLHTSRNPTIIRQRTNEN